MNANTLTDKHESFECEYCKKTFLNQYTLKTHKMNAKKCIKHRIDKKKENTKNIKDNKENKESIQDDKNIKEHNLSEYIKSIQMDLILIKSKLYDLEKYMKK